MKAAEKKCHWQIFGHFSWRPPLRSGIKAEIRHVPVICRNGSNMNMYIYLNKHISMATGSVYGLRLPGVKCLFINGKANKCTNGYFISKCRSTLEIRFLFSRQLYWAVDVFYWSKKLTEQLRRAANSMSYLFPSNTWMLGMALLTVLNYGRRNISERHSRSNIWPFSMVKRYPLMLYHFTFSAWIDSNPTYPLFLPPPLTPLPSILLIVCSWYSNT